MDAAWPLVDESALIQSTVLIILQVNGKLRARIDVQKNLDRDAMEQIALNHEAIKKYTANGSVRKVIVVPGRLVNIVVN
jgi:leucyl-tRNA synthetase